MCLVLAWKIGLADKYFAHILSHHSLVVEGQATCISHINFCSHMISAVALATDLYSVSVLDHETVFCFLVLHDTRFVPRNMAYPPVNRLPSWDPAPSASENPLTSSGVIFKPKRVLCFTYLKILLTAAKCTVVGECKIGIPCLLWKICRV
jgi:hypothetical protein